MVAKITVGTSLYGALAYNGMKVNEGEGSCSPGTRSSTMAADGWTSPVPNRISNGTCRRTSAHGTRSSISPSIRIPTTALTDMEMESLAREYLEKLGYGDQPYLIFKHEDINRHHLHIVSVNVDENGRRLNKGFHPSPQQAHHHGLERKYGLHPPTAGSTVTTIPCARWMPRRET